MFSNIFISWAIIFLLYFATNYFLKIFGEDIMIFTLGENWVGVSDILILMLPIYFVHIAAVLTDKAMLFLDYLLAKLIFNIFYCLIMLASIIWTYFVDLDSLSALGYMSNSVALTYVILNFTVIFFGFYKMKFSPAIDIGK
jgi:hypothetical protein